MKLKRLIPLALALSLLAGCGNSGQVLDPPTSSGSGASPSANVTPPPAGGSVTDTQPPQDLAACALVQASYPEFPARPEEPEDDSGWDAYFEAESAYHQAVSALRTGCGPALVRGSRALLDFAARSAPLAMADSQGENAIYSPVSLWSALVLAAQCAGGKSRDQLLSALGGSDMDALRDLMRQVWLTLYTDDGRDALTLANSLWLNGAAGGCYVQETLDTLAADCFSSVYSVPMGTGEADQAITDWTVRQTHGLIGGSGPVVETDALTLAVLASSLYYRAGWSDEFYQENTDQDIFTAADGQERQVDFMHAARDGQFLLRDGYQAAYLPTRLGEMVFVLPDEGVAPESLLDAPEFLESLNFTGESVHWGEVQWSVPKFDVNSNLNLLDTLKSLGITTLLDPDRAGLSNLTDISAYLSDVFQLSRVKVDEEGVEAAAVTILADEGGIPEGDPEVCVMDLDRPFLFVVRSQDLPLFVGVVNQVG